MTSSKIIIKSHIKQAATPDSDKMPLHQKCKSAVASKHTVATSTTTVRPSTTMLTDHKLSLFESAPVDTMDAEYKDFLMAKSQSKESNTTWKRVREEEIEKLEEWIQNKKSNIENGITELTPLNIALQQAGMLTEDVDMTEASQDFATHIKRNSSGSYNFRSRSATRAQSPGPSTSINTVDNSDTSITKDVDSLNVGKDKKRRSASRACNKKANESSMITLSALLDSADEQPSSSDSLSELISLQRGQLDPEDLQISETVLGEGQLGIVRLGFYRGLFVACKHKRQFTRSERFHPQAKRELMFATKLASCRYINRYIGWISCCRKVVEGKEYGYKKDSPFLYIVQRYVPNGDARGYLEKRGKHH